MGEYHAVGNKQNVLLLLLFIIEISFQHLQIEAKFARTCYSTLKGGERMTWNVFNCLGEILTVGTVGTTQFKTVQCFNWQMFMYIVNE